MRVRAFFGSRVFESHPLTICNAPPNTSCLSERSILLGARARGDWSNALNTYARSELPETKSKLDEDPPADVPMQVMLDGPYGGCSIDLGEFENVLLVAGGSGITFTLGLLDDLVGRCVRLRRQGSERTRHIEMAWCVRGFGCLRWFAAQLTEIALIAERDPSLSLHISVFVTCYCAPESVQPIPNCDVRVERPEVRRLLEDLVGSRAVEEEEEGDSKRRPSVNEGGGLAVCAAGPESMARQAKNALARISLTSGGRLGRIGCHTEVYSL